MFDPDDYELHEAQKHARKIAKERDEAREEWDKIPDISELQAALENTDPQFRGFVESVPDKHWSKYDLSAMRIGWEAYKAMLAARPKED